ncbi:MAG: hypothetical protein ERJ67_09385 [Aphanocapsa feldmannii 277cV]|uniref:ArsR family transcriptional regulator n=1 Tax=Aphanocapsa feldmannii 277cV TaxID=2507553 RepID=A0A524RLG2_9CHRO|nr:MAG: hypothetical protein ERJ69_02895 [Aphanocapsa feldmannii 288cV]TGG90910.1 MAG: hypothetical protein ERJ67_09385 [Aphanocapsa feldmannii 277cV]
MKAGRRFALLSAVTAHALARADRAARCGPFNRAFYARVSITAVGLDELVAQQGKPSPLSRILLSEPAAEDDLRWLLRVGLLRREVDGQGLTDRVRLTPLGREVVEAWPAGETMPSADLPTRLRNRMRRLTAGV